LAGAAAVALLWQMLLSGSDILSPIMKIGLVIGGAVLTVVLVAFGETIRLLLAVAGMLAQHTGAHDEAGTKREERK
jgi:hypothetical protein